MPRRQQLQEEANNARFCVSAPYANAHLGEQPLTDSSYIQEDVISQGAPDWARTSKQPYSGGEG